VGTELACGVEFLRTGTAETIVLDAGQVLTSIGYRGEPVPGLPFDEASAVGPNSQGRVIQPAADGPATGAYVAGWIKRGPTGFIGTNKSCAMQTVATLVDDFNAGLLNDPRTRPGALDRMIRARQVDLVDATGWRAIDAAETARGQAVGRPRVKFTSVPEMLAVAGRADTRSRSRFRWPRAGVR
jgi:ferredoxin--NADP+ reductase